MSKNEEEMLLPSEENIIMEEEFYPSATYARGQRNTTAGKSNCRFSSSGMFLSSPSACRTSGASKNGASQKMGLIDLCNFGVTWFYLVFYDKFSMNFLTNFLTNFYDEFF